MSENRDTVVIEATLYWPFLVKKNKLADKFTVDLGNLSKVDAAKIASLGVNVKHENKASDEFDRELFITCKSVYPINKVDFKDGNPVSEDTLARVGNGTKVRAQIGTYSGTFKGRPYTSPSLVKMVIHDLVEYSATESIGELYEDAPKLSSKKVSKKEALDDEIPF